MSEARPHLAAVPDDAPATAPAPAPRESSFGRYGMWALLAAILLALGLLLSILRGADLQAQLDASQASLAASEARVDALEGHLGQVREGTREIVSGMGALIGQMGALAADLDALGTLVESDPDAAASTSAPAEER